MPLMWFLLDEPFGALDAKVRKDLRHWLRRLHDELHITSVFVTHDQEEALEVADDCGDESRKNLKAKITYTHSIGPAVRLELERDDNKTFVEAELTRERFDEINLIEGETTYLKPRNLQVFLA